MSNVFSFTGTIGRDAEVKYLPSGQALLTVAVANNVGYGDKQKTIWVRVNLWGKRAEGSLKDYLVKGQQVFCSGEMSINEYKGNDGTQKYSVELNANIVDLVGGKRDASEQGGSPPRQQPPQPQHNAAKSDGYAPKPADDVPYDDDIPF
jgi:single-strand DNA-binding protein